MVVYPLDGTVFRHELAGSDLANALHSGHIVSRVTADRKHVDDLGRGLDALIPPSPKKETGKGNAPSGKERIFLDINRVEPNRSQPRKTFDEDGLLELAESIRQFGILEPLLVRDKGDYYDIIFGERRWRAARKAGLKEVPAIIRNDLTEQQIVEIQLIENIQRESLNPIEEAQAYERLVKEFHLKQDEIAERVSKSRVAITNAMRLLKLCPEVQQMVIEEKLQTGHARALIPVEQAEEQLRLAERIFDEKLSVREAEKMVKQLGRPEKQGKRKKQNAALENIYRELAERCKNKLGTKVEIVPRGEGGAGKIEIEFYSGEDLERITDLLINNE